MTDGYLREMLLPIKVLSLIRKDSTNQVTDLGENGNFVRTNQKSEAPKGIYSLSIGSVKKIMKGYVASKFEE